VQIPVGLSIITLTLFAIAVVNLFTKPIATIAGGTFSVLLFIGFTISERLTRVGGSAHVEMDQFNLESESELTPEAVGARPGNILVPVSNIHALYHLANVLDRVKPGRRDVVVLHVRLLRRSASGEYELEAEQLLEYRTAVVLAGAFPCREARQNRPAGRRCVNNLWDGVLRAATSLQSSTIVLGRSQRIRGASTGVTTLGKNWVTQSPNST
jgi:hypothetical protein